MFFQECSDRFNNIIQLIGFNALMDADMRPVIGTVFCFRKIAEPVAQKSIARALRGHRVKKIAGIDPGLIQIIDKILFAEIDAGFQHDREGVRADRFASILLQINKVVLESFEPFDQI